MKPESLALIRSIQLFNRMSEEAFHDMVRGAFVQQFPPNVTLIQEGDASDFLYIIGDGMVELFANWERNETTMAMLFENSTFILAATISGGHYLMSARTHQKSNIIMIPSENVRDAFKRDQEFALAVNQELAKIFRALVRNTKNLKLRNTSERVANYLVKCLARSNEPNRFHFSYEKRLVASKLGMTPENFSRALNGMKDIGVEVHGDLVTIKDKERLIAFAKPDPTID